MESLGRCTRWSRSLVRVVGQVVHRLLKRIFHGDICTSQRLSGRYLAIAMSAWTHPSTLESCRLASRKRTVLGLPFQLAGLGTDSIG